MYIQILYRYTYTISLIRQSYEYRWVFLLLFYIYSSYTVYSERIWWLLYVAREPCVHESKQLIAAVNSFEHRRSNHAVASVFTAIRWYSFAVSGNFFFARLFHSSKIVFRLIRVYSLYSFDIIARPRYQISPLAN